MNDTDLLEAALYYSGSIVIIGSSLRDNEGQIDDFRIRFASHNIDTITGVSASDATTRTVRDLLMIDKTSTVWQQIVDVVDTGMTRDVEMPLTIKSGGMQWFLTSLYRHDDGIALSLRNVTKAKLTEQATQKTIDELQRSNQNLEQFAYVASHDLQEPLRKIVSFSDVLQHQYAGSMDEYGVKLLQRIQLSTERMQGLIKNLLSFSRVVSAKAPFKRINLQDIVNDVISDLDMVIHEKNAVLDVTSLPYLDGDAGQLSQLFQNLLSNALKFTRPGDVPLIRIDCEVLLGSAIRPMAGTPVLATDLNRSFFAIIVSDNGIGFDEKYLDRIFTIFQRLHNRNEYPGTGIGLAIVQKVVDNHKGYLNARSQPGKGAEFTIYLPDEPAPINVVI